MNEDVGTPIELDVPRNIQLALSGGGFRAASFHLGVFSVLDTLGLRESVRAVSSVSGGSILLGMYLRNQSEKRDFQAFFAEAFEQLKSQNVIERALDKVSDQEHSLIAAAADVYKDEALCGRLRFSDIDALDTHFDEIAINATEFYGGNSFRFIRSPSSLAAFGNGKLKVDRPDISGQVMVADAVAASSCFPGAFEPLTFPHDFEWGDDGMPDPLKEWQPLALMDGGIYDNQGVSSLLLVNRRSAEPADLILISDTFQWQRPLFQQDRWAPPANPWALILVLTVIGFFFALAFSMAFISSWIAFSAQHYIQGTVFAIAAIPWAAALIAPIFLWRRLRNVIFEQGVDADRVWSRLRRLGVRTLYRFVASRASSAVAMAANIFMKIVREGVYKAAFREAQVPEYRLITNEIFDLQTQNAPPISPALQRAVDSANAMRTTLWVQDEEQLRNTIACGQATTCFNLLGYIEEFSDDPDFEDITGPLRDLALQLQQLVRQLEADPDHLTTVYLSR